MYIYIYMWCFYSFLCIWLYMFLSGINTCYSNVFYPAVMLFEHGVDWNSDAWCEELDRKLTSQQKLGWSQGWSFHQYSEPLYINMKDDIHYRNIWVTLKKIRQIQQSQDDMRVTQPSSSRYDSDSTPPDWSRARLMHSNIVQSAV